MDHGRRTRSHRSRRYPRRRRACTTVCDCPRRWAHPCRRCPRDRRRCRGARLRRKRRGKPPKDKPEPDALGRVTDAGAMTANQQNVFDNLRKGRERARDDRPLAQHPEYAGPLPCPARAGTRHGRARDRLQRRRGPRNHARSLGRSSHGTASGMMSACHSPNVVRPASRPPPCSA